MFNVKKFDVMANKEINYGEKITLRTIKKIVAEIAAGVSIL